MKKAYLFIYNDEVGSRESMVAFLDSMKSVLTWRYDMPNVFYIISENSADTIIEEFESKAGIKGRFICLEYNGNAQGRITGDSWYLLANKKHNTDK